MKSSGRAKRKPEELRVHNTQDIPWQLHLGDTPLAVSEQKELRHVHLSLPTYLEG